MRKLFSQLCRLVTTAVVLSLLLGVGECVPQQETSPSPCDKGDPLYVAAKKFEQAFHCAHLFNLLLDPSKFNSCGFCSTQLGVIRAWQSAPDGACKTSVTIRLQRVYHKRREHFSLDRYCDSTCDLPEVSECHYSGGNQYILDTTP